jgi:DNA-binding XRE family transcriptional regulator
VTSAEFKIWRERLGLSQPAAADALGVSKGSIELYERGSRRDDNRHVEIPVTVELSCKYLAQQGRLRRHLELVESGKMTTRGEKSGVMVDTTQEWACELKNWISDLDFALRAIRPIVGGFRLVRIEFGDFGEMLQRKTIDRFATKQEAEEAAKRVANEAPGKPGYNDEHGYWWSRDLSVGKAYRYVVETAE